MNGPLDGLNVVDLSEGMSGALTTMLLADNGACVTKVESPEADPLRSFPPMTVWNRGKRSVILDLVKEQDKRQFFGLLETADVLVESYKVGETFKLGIDHATIKNTLPSLIYCSLTGYGQFSSDRKRFGYDGLVQAKTGLQWIQQGHREGPVYMGFPAPSYAGGFMASYGILSALHARSITGKGQHIDASLLGATLLMQRWLWSESVADAAEPVRLNLVRMLRCQDGEYLWIHTGARGSFERLMKVLDLPEFGLGNSGVRPDSTTTQADADRLSDKVEQIIASKPRAEWMTILDKADIPNRQVLYPGESFSDEQINAIKSTISVEDSQMGLLKEVAPPYRFARTPVGHPGSAPELGEHSEEIKEELENGVRSNLTSNFGKKSAGFREMRHALEDLLIIDFGQFIAAPMAARLCSDLGARVIRIEPVDGETMRPRHDQIDSLSKTFQQANAGKQGIAVNLKDPEGLAIAHKLISKADVVVHNFRPGVVERLGIAYETASNLNPNVIYCACPGFGSTGPRKHMPGFEPLYAAFCGVQRNCGGKGNPPIQTTSLDQYCGLLAANAILMALHHRDLTGKGQYVEVPQLAQVMYYTSEVFFKPDGSMGWDPALDADQTGYDPFNRLYRTKDGWICISCIKDEEKRALFDALECKLCKHKPEEKIKELSGFIEQTLQSKTAQEWEERLQKHKVPFEVPIMDGEGIALTNSEYLDSGLVAEYKHPNWVKIRAPGVGIGLSETPGVSQGPPPLLGQHTRDILREIGYSQWQIQDLDKRGLVACAEPIVSSA